VNLKTNYRITRIACHLGYITQAIVLNLTAVLFIVFQEAYGVSYQQLGFIVFAMFITQIVTLTIVVNLIDQRGYRFFAVIAHVIVVIGMILLGTLPNTVDNSYIAIIVSVVIYAFGGGIIEVVANPVVAAIAGEEKSASLNFLHSFFCWGHVATIIVTTLLLQVVGRDMWGIIPLLWAIIPFVNIFLFAKAPLTDSIPKQERVPIHSLLSNRIFILMLIMILCAGAAEQVIAQWISIFAEEGLHFQKVVGDLIGLTLFAGLMGVSRLMLAFNQRKSANLSRSLFIFSVFCVICYILIVTAQQPLMILLVCAAFGFFVAPLWPELLALNGEVFPLGGAASFGLLTISGSLGCAIGPWTAGVVSDIYGLRNGQLIGLFFALLFVIMIIVFNKKHIRAE